MIRTKCVTTAIDRKKDGLRILTTRFLGRYMRSTRYDVWMPNLGPSEALLRGDKDWPEYGRLYRKELFEGGSIDRRNKTIKNHGQKFTLRLLQKLAKRGSVTLLCHCAEDADNCHRYTLKDILDGVI